MNAELTELVFILDRSGSMNGLESDTIGGFNGMISRQKAEGEKVNVTTLLFDEEVSELVKPLTETMSEGLSVGRALMHLKARIKALDIHK